MFFLSKIKNNRKKQKNVYHSQPEMYLQRVLFVIFQVKSVRKRFLYFIIILLNDI